MLDEINQDYVRTARAKGVGENRIMWVHVLRNASIPIITHVMAALPGLLIGAFLIERFFSIPGIGREVILAVERSDFPVIKAITVYVAVATMVVNLLGRPDVQGGRPAGPAEVERDDARTTLPLQVAAPRARPREIPHTVSPGLWTLAWRRLRRDHVGMVSLAIVAAFLVLMILSGIGPHREGLVARGRRQLRAADVRRRGRRGRHARRRPGAPPAAEPPASRITSRRSSIRSAT